MEILLKAFESAHKYVDYYALDLSLSELHRTFSKVRTNDFTYVGFHGLYGTYNDGLAWLRKPENRELPTVVLTMGSSIGNFALRDAAEFLGSFASLLGPSDLMIVGLDACHDGEKVFRAYNDGKGITQKFYRNGLINANRVLGYEAFVPAEWEVDARYDADDCCHRAFYRSLRDTSINGVTIPKGEEVSFEAAYKYGVQERGELWHTAGLVPQVDFTNRSGDYRKPSFT